LPGIFGAGGGGEGQNPAAFTMGEQRQTPMIRCDFACFRVEAMLVEIIIIPRGGSQLVP
jgi:hypothetical protein